MKAGHLALPEMLFRKNISPLPKQGAWASLKAPCLTQSIMIPAIFFILIILIFGTMLWAGFSAAPWVPSLKKDISRVIESAQIKPGETVFDLGCGDGRWLIAIAKKTKADRIVGFEISLLMYAWSRIKILFNNYPQIEIKYKNLFKTDLSQADVILCFLMPRAMKKLENKFKTEMKPGSRLVSYAFSLPGYKPEKVNRISEKSLPVYVYRF